MHILIAEDDGLIRQGLSDLLEKEGYRITASADGVEALAAFQRTPPDLVILDIMMPQKDGYQVCREIRQQNQDIPIIFLSAKSEEIDKVLGLELGADDYIVKPFGTREVVARIRAVTRRYLSKAPQPANNLFHMNDLEVHPLALRAKRGDQLFDLSLRDIQILTVLYQHKNQVVTRDQLFDHCWGRDYLPSSRTLDQHISKLRKIIEVDHKNPTLIKTAHGVGYRFDES